MPATDLMAREVRQGWGSLHYDQSVEGKPLRILGRTFRRGLGTHANSSISYYLADNFGRFQAWVGVDAEMTAYPAASVVFEVYLDGKKAFDSGTMHVTDAAKRVDIDVSRAIEMRLVVTDAGDGVFADHGDWADAQLLPIPKAWLAAKPLIGQVFRASGLAVQVVDTAGTLEATLDGHKYWVRTGLEGARSSGTPAFTKGAGGGWTIRQELSCPGGHRVRETQTLSVDGDSIGWTVQIEGEDTPWSAPIDTTLATAGPTRIWMAGAKTLTWEDPLEFWAPKRGLFAYGKPFYRAEGISLPLASIWPDKSPRALVLAMSPKDALLAMDVATRPGSIQFSRTLHRIQKGRPIVFHMNLVPVAPDCRSVLGWMVKKYTAYFDPPNPLAHRIGGLGAYSGYEGKPDAVKLRAMDFKVNWKASIDFPYMGMFLPPVGPDEKWNRFAGGGGGGYGPGDEGRFGQTSLRQLEEYNQRMRLDGFYVLNYFNVTEFGGNIAYPPPADLGSATWKDPERFLFGTFPSAILKDPDPLWTWGGAIIADCADPPYRDFLLDQARRHLSDLPSGSGICIDRTDWLDRTNPAADDGQTWSNGPRRSLLNSWKSFMATLGPMMHKAGKVIFINTLIRRLDIMGEVDGVYDEFGDDGGNLNGSAFLCLRKPLICWTASEDRLKPDPDAYLQQRLYMGAFPTAPLAGNDHTLVPSAWVDPYYLAYGPLFHAIEGRKWVLKPGLVSVQGAKANLFSVPGGYVVPIVFGGKKGEARLTLSLPRIAKVYSLCPGETAWHRLAGKDGVYSVPLKRGCAVVRAIEG